MNIGRKIMFLSTDVDVFDFLGFGVFQVIWPQGHCPEIVSLITSRSPLYGKKYCKISHSTDLIWTAPCENESSGICGRRRPRSDCTNAQSDQGLRSPLPESLATIECINGERTPGWDLAHAQDDVNPHILRMLECSFLLDAPISSYVSEPIGKVWSAYLCHTVRNRLLQHARTAKAKIRLRICAVSSWPS